MNEKEYKKLIRAIRAYGEASLNAGDYQSDSNFETRHKAYDKVIALLKAMVVKENA